MSFTYWRLVKSNSNFRKLWLAQSISLLGDWFSRIALLVFVNKHTDSGLYLGLVLVCSFLPSFLLGPVAGVIIDRFNRKKILIISDVIRGHLALGFLFVTPEQIWLLFVIEFLLFSGSAFFQPAKNAIIPNITTKEKLTAANALSQTTWGVMLALGSLLGGIVVSISGFYLAIAINSITFFISAYFIKTIQYKEKSEQEPGLLSANQNQSSWGDFKQGLLYILKDRFILAIIMIKPGWAVAGGIILTLHTKFGEDIFNAEGYGTGILYMCRGLGVIIGSFIGRWYLNYIKTNILWVITLIYFLFGLLYGAFSMMPDLISASIMLTIATATSSNLWLFNQIILQQTVPDKLRGRVFAHNEALSFFFLMASSLLGGKALDYFPPRELALIAALMIIGSGVLGLLGIITGIIPKKPKVVE